MTISHPEIEDEANEIVKNFSNFFARKPSFAEAKICYFKWVKSKIRNAYKKFSNFDKLMGGTMPALYVCLFESIKLFQETLKNIDNDKNKTLVLHCFSCLNENNEVIYDCLLNNYELKSIKIKRHILKQFIQKRLKGQYTC